MQRVTDGVRTRDARLTIWSVTATLRSPWMYLPGIGRYGGEAPQ
jgi:hypothetical protein